MKRRIFVGFTVMVIFYFLVLGTAFSGKFWTRAEKRVMNLLVKLHQIQFNVKFKNVDGFELKQYVSMYTNIKYTGTFTKKNIFTIVPLMLNTSITIVLSKDQRNELSP